MASRDVWMDYSLMSRQFFFFLSFILEKNYRQLWKRIAKLILKSWVCIVSF